MDKDPYKYKAAMLHTFGVQVYMNYHRLRSLVTGDPATLPPRAVEALTTEV